jgi:hypothetical protein
MVNSYVTLLQSYLFLKGTYKTFPIIAYYAKPTTVIYVKSTRSETSVFCELKSFFLICEKKKKEIAINEILFYGFLI